MWCLQEFKIGEVGKGGWDGPGEVIVVEIQAHKAPQSSKLFWYTTHQVVHVQFPIILYNKRNTNTHQPNTCHQSLN